MTIGKLRRRSQVDDPMIDAEREDLTILSLNVDDTTALSIYDYDTASTRNTSCSGALARRGVQHAAQPLVELALAPFEQADETCLIQAISHFEIVYG